MLAKKMQNLDLVEEAIAQLKLGKIVILTDDEGRENEGDFVCAAESATPEVINFMAMHGRGLVCLALDPQIADRLNLQPMVNDNRSPLKTNFMVSIEAATGVSTGISAYDRSHTIQAAISDTATPQDIVSPGHVFPLKAAASGTLIRAGQTEGSVDLARLAGLKPAAVICEIMNADGTMARYKQLRELADKFDITIVSIADIIAYRKQHERLIERITETKLPTKSGTEFKIIGYRTTYNDEDYVAITLGELSDEPTLVRIHSQCLTGDVFGSTRCDCGEQLDAAIAMIEREERGVILYLPQEGRGIGLINKLRSYELQDQGVDTLEANHRLGFDGDLRDYELGAQTLHDLGIKKVRLMTNNPHKVVGINGHGLDVVERVPVVITPRDSNRSYLATKKNKMGHLLDV